MRIFLDKAWLRALAGLSINFSAAFFLAPFIGVNFSIPDSILDGFVLIGNIGIGIIFLWMTVKLERRIKK